jgi:hypothetical protein
VQLTCPACGLTFETQATTNTRCRRCRKVVNVGARNRPAPVAAAPDDTSAQWSPTLIGTGLAAGGAAALWYGVRMRRASLAAPDDTTTGRGRAWLWCAFGVVLFVAGVIVVIVDAPRDPRPNGQ